MPRPVYTEKLISEEFTGKIKVVVKRKFWIFSKVSVLFEYKRTLNIFDSTNIENNQRTLTVWREPKIEDFVNDVWELEKSNLKVEK